MKGLTQDNFGLIIAFLIPGFVALVGISYHSRLVASWMSVSSSDAPTVAGFLFVTLASLAVGLVANVARITLVDWLHSKTGVPLPELDFAKLATNLDAYQAVVEEHYRYSQYYGNTLVALLFSYIAYLIAGDILPWEKMDAFVGVVTLMLFHGSRQQLKKYSDRAARVLPKD